MQAKDVNQAVLAWLDTSPPPPLFAYIHYIDVHGPYLEPRPFGRPKGSVDAATAEKARLHGKPKSVAIDLYDGELQDLDARIGEFLRELESRGVLQDSIVIITSDHGEEFGDHGNHGHGHTLHEELLHVPWIMVRTQAFPFTSTIETPVAQVDLLPTLASALGIAIPENLPGQNLFPALRRGGEPEGRPILSEMDNRGRPVWNAKPDDLPLGYAVLVPPDTKYILSAKAPYPSDGVVEPEVKEIFFALGSDPRERVERTPQESQRERARAALGKLLDAARAVEVEPGVAPLDKETRARLHALGYLPSDETALP